MRSFLPRPGIPIFIAFVCTPWAETISIFVMFDMFCILGILGIFDKFVMLDMFGMFMLDMLDIFGMFGMIGMFGKFDMFAIGAPGCGSGIVIGGGSSFIHAFSSMLVHFPLVPAWLCFRC